MNPNPAAVNPDDTALTSEGYATTSDREITSMPHSDFAATDFGQISAIASKVTSSLTSQLNANPLLAIGAVGAGALAIGYLLGRALSTPKSPVVHGFSERHMDIRKNENPVQFQDQGFAGYEG